MLMFQCFWDIFAKRSYQRLKGLMKVCVPPPLLNVCLKFVFIFPDFYGFCLYICVCFWDFDMCLLTLAYDLNAFWALISFWHEFWLKVHVCSNFLCIFILFTLAFNLNIKNTKNIFGGKTFFKNPSF